MYFSLLNQTIKSIKQVSNIVAPKPNLFDMWAISLYPQEKQQEIIEQQEKAQRVENILVAGATAAAVIGEAIVLINKKRNN